ncbi:unnamed protein product [Musa hybrid cultivar]
MPRLLPLDSLIAGTTKASSGAAATFLLLCAFALMACASHGRRWCRRRPEPVISVHQVQPGAEEAEACVWQKNILMGGKCELPDFSGVVAYDSKGNIVAPGRSRAALALK